MENKWMYEISDGSVWTGEKFDTKEECIENGRVALEAYNKDRINTNGTKRDMFRIGQVEKVLPSGVDVDFILENVAENTTIDTLEVGEDYLMDVKREHEEELEEKLNEVLFDWIDKYGYNPDFFKIVNVEEIKI